MKRILLLVIFTQFMVSISYAVEVYESTYNTGQNKLERINHIEQYMNGLSKEIKDLKKEVDQLKKEIQSLREGNRGQSSSPYTGKK
jgi:peptidoglycan hydrolase CwlO-like protein